jgi:hypothetical protein
MHFRIRQFVTGVFLSILDFILFIILIYAVIVYVAPFVIQHSYDFLQSGKLMGTCHDIPDETPMDYIYRRARYYPDMSFDEQLKSDSEIDRDAGRSRLLEKILYSAESKKGGPGHDDSDEFWLSDRELDTLFKMLVTGKDGRNEIAPYVVYVWIWSKDNYRTAMEHKAARYLTEDPMTPFDFLGGFSPSHVSSGSFLYAAAFYFTTSYYFYSYLHWAVWCPKDWCGTCEWGMELYRRQMIIKSASLYLYQSGWLALFILFALARILFACQKIFSPPQNRGKSSQVYPIVKTNSWSE